MVTYLDPQEHLAVRLDCTIIWLAIVTCGVSSGCRYVANRAQQAALADQQSSERQLALQDFEYQRRADNLDVNNRELHTQLAQSQREVQLLKDEVGLLRNRLGETVDLLAEAQLSQEDSDQRWKSLQTSTQRRGGAVITANSSLQQDLPRLNLPGVEVRQDGDVIRIEISTDRIFLSRSATLHQNSLGILNPIAELLQEKYPRQRIGIEGHSDNRDVLSTQWRSQHQFTLAQAGAVFDQFTTRYRISSSQLFVLGHGANHPRVSNATSAGQTKNRRIEVVIYPETISGR